MSGKFRFTVPGDPPSWNHMYKMIRLPRKGGLGYYQHLAKGDEVENYQLVASTFARRAKPADFAPTGMVYVRYWLYLDRDKDASNCIKAIEDGIAAGLDINDKMFLPAVLYKSHGNKDPHVVCEIEW